MLRRVPDVTSEHIVLIGAGELTALYLKLLEAYLPGQHRAIGILDERAEFIGRKVRGVPVVGTPEDLEALISEYAIHGVRADRVLVGGDPDLLSANSLKELDRVCAHWNLNLDFIPRLMGLWDQRMAQPLGELSAVPDELPRPGRYIGWKVVFDFYAALVLLIVLSPLLLLAAGLVFVDVGAPVLFWQQRMGLGGRSFLLYKFRTLRPPFDWKGRRIPDEQRLSTLGRFLRKTRLDELPQLLNVLIGEMGLIGPRPLLPEDQPPNAAVRLTVRPGITGWAQVNGGKLLTAEEKHHLDEWYIRNASIRLDLKILLATAMVALVGERRSKPTNEDIEKLSPPSFDQRVPAYATPVANDGGDRTTRRRRIT
ncbi:MAG: sugar transferase [Xanthobacteraceae bacterium]